MPPLWGSCGTRDAVKQLPKRVGGESARVGTGGGDPVGGAVRRPPIPDLGHTADASALQRSCQLLEVLETRSADADDAKNMT